jgi:imidazolonepropionase-like amidohydrolase
MTTTPSAFPPKLLWLAGARLLDPADGQFVDAHDVLVADGRIVQIAPAAELPPPPHAERLDLAGLTLLPGLMDLHSHLLLHPYSEASWDDQVLRESLELRTIQAVVAARATLAAGFTVLRDLGTEGAGFADVALRDAIARGLVPGPRLFVATRAIVATGCYGPSGFDPRWNVPKGAQVADGVDGVRRAVREQIAAGADWVKLYADYRRRPGELATPTFSQDELNVAVYEAHSAGLPVAVHAATNEAIRRCVLAGVNTVEHGYYVGDEVLALMRERGVALCPTLAASEAMAGYEGWKAGQPEPPRIQRMRALMARALHAGVTIACGSDVGVFAHGENARELELMNAYGMTAMDVLRSATSVAARVVGCENDLGRIAAGFVADLIAVRGDPLADLGVLRTPALVVKNGRVFKTGGVGVPPAGN